MSGSQKDPRGGALPSRYDFARYEREVYRMWEEGGYFSAPVDEDPEKVPHYCIVIPPPNITGELHMGHALNNTIQDVLIRYHRMLGEGDLPLAPFLAQLRSDGYCGPVSLEVSPWALGAWSLRRTRQRLTQAVDYVRSACTRENQKLPQ